MDGGLYRKQIEFKRMKRLYFKEHPKICANCGNFHHIIQLHHKKPLEEGGNNIFNNLVPLCPPCCQAWQEVAETVSMKRFLEQSIS